MRLQALYTLAGLVLLATAARADVVPVGTLRCTIGAGAGLPVGAYRDVVCTYERPNFATERYEGFTGVITADTTGAQVVSYEVSSPDPDALAALAALAGDYDQNLFGSPAITRPAANSLLGGRRRRIILQPITNGATTNLAVLNYFLGVTQLHLTYAGVSSHRVTAPSHRRGPAS